MGMSFVTDGPVVDPATLDDFTFTQDPYTRRPFVRPEPRLPPENLASSILLECRTRIFAKVSDNTQKNLTANAVAGDLTGQDLAAYKAGVRWIRAMQTAARTMVAASDPDYKLDSKWPVCPADAEELATRY